MGIPRLPKEKHRPNLDETIIDLMESIAKEELALSQLISSESNKINAFVGEHLDFPTCPTTTEILTFNHSVNKLIDTVLMKEWLLLKKLETVTQIKATLKASQLCLCGREVVEKCCCENDDSENNECYDDEECSCEESHESECSNKDSEDCSCVVGPESENSEEFGDERLE